jgi:cytochrome c oxidase assembly protein subunit 15
MSHFLLSMLILADAIVLYVRAGYPDEGVTRPRVATQTLRMAWLLTALATVVVVTGTVVTNSGPHAGDLEAKRFGFRMSEVARVHGTSVMVFLALVLLTLVVAHRTGALARLQQRLTTLLVVLVAQAGIGYWQYFTGVPVLLVGVHVAGATAVWTATLFVLLGCYERTTGDAVAGEPLGTTPEGMLAAT